MGLVYLSPYRVWVTFFIAFLCGLLIQAQNQAGLMKENMNFIIYFFVCLILRTSLYHGFSKILAEVSIPIIHKHIFMFQDSSA